MSKMLYLIGSLRNERIPRLAERLRKETDFEVFDDWYSAGPEADDYWKTHQQDKGLSYQEALSGYAARNVFAFDKRHLDRCTHALLVLPAGKSGHMEIMYSAYSVGAKSAILLDPTDVRWDVMYQFVDVLDNDDAIGPWLGEAVSTKSSNRGTNRVATGIYAGPDRPQRRLGKSPARIAKHGSDVGYGTGTRLWSE